MNPVDTAILESKLAGIVLKRGGHTKESGDRCAEEAVAWLAGEEHSDNPQCVDVAISAFRRRWNDLFTDDAERTRRILPTMLPSLWTHGSRKLALRRANLAVDWSVRIRIPAVLRALGYATDADRLASCAPIVDAMTLNAARIVANKISAPWQNERSFALGASAVTNAGYAAREAVRGAVDEAIAARATADAYSVADRLLAANTYEAIVNVAIDYAAGCDHTVFTRLVEAGRGGGYTDARQLAFELIGVPLRVKLEDVIRETNAGARDLVLAMCAMTEDSHV